MQPSELFQTAHGTTAGTKHRRGLLESNQDSVLVHNTDNLVSLCVSDGCSSSPLSYVGSSMQVSWLTQLAHEAASNGQKFDDELWQHFAATIADRITTCAGWGHLSPEANMAEAWAATLGGIFVSDEITQFAFFGDGHLIINGEEIVIGAANEDNNQPAYPVYLASGSTLPEEKLRFTVITHPTAEIQHAVIATDGLAYLADNVGKLIPGTSDRIPELSYLWEFDGFFTDPRELNNWLNYIGRDIRKTGNILSGGKLLDDVAIATIRRKPQEPQEA